MATRALHFFDYKSPYAYLAQQTAFRFAEESGVDIEWRPYTLDIPQFLGRAELDEKGRDVWSVASDDRTLLVGAPSTSGDARCVGAAYAYSTRSRRMPMKLDFGQQVAERNA